MEQKATTRIVTLKDLWEIFVRRLWVLILAAVVAMGGMFLAIRLTFVPEYKSTATLYILRQEQRENSNGSSDDFSLALKVVNDCDYLLKSHSVLDEVLEDLQLDVSYQDLVKSVSTSNPENTRILEVTVTAESPEEAKRIVDSVCTVGAEKIEEAMGFKQVNLYELGTLNSRPSNVTGLVTYLLVGIVVAVLAYTAFLIAFLLDDRIQTADDIARYLDLSILGDIPNADAPSKGRYGYYAAYGKNTGKGKGK